MGFPLIHRARRLTLAFAVTLAAGLVTVPADSAHAAPACKVTYQKTWDNGSGFGANLIIENLGDPLAGWALTYAWPGNQRVGSGWSAVWSQEGANVTARNATWNGTLATNASVAIGFNGTYTGANPDPISFALNDTVCTGQPPASPQLELSNLTLLVPENGTANFSVRLTAQPSGTVTVTSAAGTGDTSITVVSGAVLTFTPANWQTSQRVTLAAAEDTDVSPGIRQITVSAPGMTPVTVTATELDNDVCLCPPVITPTSLIVPEGSSATFTIRLSAAPATNVTVTISATGGGDPDLTLCSGAVLTFTPANWQIPQTVRICAAEDADSVNGSRTFVVAFVGVTPIAITVTEADNDLPGSKVDNPFAGASGYVNPDRQSQLNTEAANHPAALAAAIRTVGQQPTGVWLDRIAAITAERGLTGHLNEALAQDAANGASPVVVTLVLYNLPNRNCTAPVGGELTVAGNGLARYRTEFIDPIRAILARPEYANLRVAVVLEPDSLVTDVTHHQSRPAVPLRCLEAQVSAVHREGVRYAINQLTTLPNSYLYVDISTSAWLGWDENFTMAVNLYDNVLAAGQGGPGYDKIHGFALNTAAYTPTEEIFLPNPLLAIGGQPVFSARFYEFNPRFDERDFATNLTAAFATRCAGCGMLIDTSRNGWGGLTRPTRLTVTGDVETYVNENRLDRRPSRLGFCNQVGAGIGVRPTASTDIPGVDAFAWIKPPGESDGISRPNIPDEDDPSKVFDPMCDPAAMNRFVTTIPTNAMPEAPHRGRLFAGHLVTLVQNAYPPL